MTSSVVDRVTRGAYSAITSNAFWWLSSVDPAQASVTTATDAPASAAASTVEMTQQSVATPATTREGCSPTTRRRSAVHLPNVVATTVRSASGATSSVSS